MKTITKSLRFALLMGLLTIGMTALAQDIPNAEKMSIPTMMLIDQLEGRANFDEVPIKGAVPEFEPIRKPTKYDRPFTPPDTIDGKVFVRAFIFISDESGLSELENLGVIIRCSFGDGLYTTFIPVEKIHEVAALDVVTKIEVATPMQPFTDKGREATNVDDVLNLTVDAVAAGLDKQYDGSGVILGIIDSSIDYQHIAFKDKNGNSRIKRAYVYNGQTEREYTSITSTTPTTDDSTGDHGTHTSSAAGGSSVIIDGTSVTVTDDHANATYGGMAPGADLYLAGTYDLSTDVIANAFNAIVNYADSENKPLVVSNSWGSHTGPHDGSSAWATVVNNYFGDSHPNRICLFSAGNTSGSAQAGQNGGCHLMGTASSSNPLRTILQYLYSRSTSGDYYYSGTIASAWCRTPNVTLNCRIYVLDTSTGEILQSNAVNPTSGSYSTVNVSSYFSGTLRVYRGTPSNKSQIRVYASSLQTTQHTNGVSRYALAIELYPSSGSAVIDVWGGNSGYFTDYITTSGYNWVAGTDNGGMGENAVIPGVISVGAYCTKNKITDYQGTTYSNGNFVIDDIAYFSSYGTPDHTPLGEMYPWITAPGARTVAAVNHYNTGDDGYINGSRINDRVNDNTTYPYGAMQGTSMSTPIAAGIVALWLQAAHEEGKDLYTSDVKEIMKKTAIHDYWTDSGKNAERFGNGKINALGGIQYILGRVATINASPTEVTFDGQPENSYTQSVTVSGINLSGDIIATLNDDSGYFSINTTNLGEGGQLVITYSPTSQGEQSATITLTSPGAEPVTITITASAYVTGSAVICDGRYIARTLPHVGTYHDEDQHNQMVYPARKFSGTGMAGKRLKSMTFYPTYGTITQNERTYRYTGINFYDGSVTFKLANLPSGSQGFDQNNPEFYSAPLTTVKTVVMPSAPDKTTTQWVINFDEGNNFVYDGGDLLIDVSNEPGIWGYTFFEVDTLQDIRPGYVTHTSGSYTTDYLPTVEFEWYESFISGTVSPTELEFNYVKIGRQYTQTVTITNNGTEPFTPVIDTTNLPAEFTVTGSGELLPDGTLDLTVTYSPTDEGPHSGSFTITIGEQIYTVTVSGYAAADASMVYSNHEPVLVFKTETQAMNASYQVSDIDNDTDHGLPVGDDKSNVWIQVVGDNAITHYEINRQNGDSDWAVVAVANHNGNEYTQQGYSDNTVTVADGATAWMNLVDNARIASSDAVYVPVTHANGLISEDNTYGAGRQGKEETDLSAIVQSIEMSSEYAGGQPWTEDGKIYTHYTILLDIDKLIIPKSETDPTKDYDLYKVRAWRQVNPDLLNERYYEASTGNSGKNREERLTENGEFLFEELDHDHYSYISVNSPGNQYYLGNNTDLTSFYPNWTSRGSYEVMATFGAQKLRENDEETGVIETLPMVFTIRAYYTRTANITENGKKGTRDGESAADGKYYILEYELPLTLVAGDPNIHTAVNGIAADREVVDVTYFNTLGMQSSKPFEGMNIVVTRYSDGTVSTTKVLK